MSLPHGDAAPRSPRQPAATMTIEEVARVLGLCRSFAYEKARADELPVPVIRVGRKLLVSRQAVERLLAADKSPVAGAA